MRPVAASTRLRCFLPATCACRHSKSCSQFDDLPAVAHLEQEEKPQVSARGMSTSLCGRGSEFPFVSEPKNDSRALTSMWAWLVVVIPQISHLGCGFGILSSSSASSPSAASFASTSDSAATPAFAPEGLVAGFMCRCNPSAELQDNCWLDEDLFLCSGASLRATHRDFNLLWRHSHVQVWTRESYNSATTQAVARS